MAKTAAELAQAYAMKGPALDLGSVVLEGTFFPEARVRMPFKGFARSAASAAGREITRSLFGTARRSRPRRRSSGGW